MKRTTSLAATWLLLVLLTGRAAAAELPWIRIADDGRSFVAGSENEPFRPLGFNYDHDAGGRLLEDYWQEAWEAVEGDFREMKQLGANVVRIHLQFGKFMESPVKAREAAFRQLDRLVQLAADTQLYLDVTGLGCYHRADVPDWYDSLDEQERWNAQARFWEAIVRRYVNNPAIFCYDLMNEPVVPGGDRPRTDWLGPAFAGKHFVQMIALERAGRERPDIARQWIEHLVEAIRRHDSRHLITVGMVPWSLDRPGLTSGFVPEMVADKLDFIAVHIYPESGKLDEATETLRGFAIGKPLVVEEIFPLKCSSQQLDRFMEANDDLVAGWIGFYWGKTLEETRQSGTLQDAITAQWLELFQRRAQAAAPPDR